MEKKNMKRSIGNMRNNGAAIRLVIMILTIVITAGLFTACNLESPYIDALREQIGEEMGLGGGLGYNVIYNGNGHDGGAPPTDENTYIEGQSVTVKGQGSLTLSGATFVGWNTNADGSGTDYLIESMFLMPASNLDLYAQWTTNPTYTVTYYGSGSDSGTAPEDNNNYEEGDIITVKYPGDLTKTGCDFNGWNTQADGGGTMRSPDSTFVMGNSDIELHSQWTIRTYTINYNANTSTSGSTPIDSSVYNHGEIVTVIDNTGNLIGPEIDGVHTGKGIKQIFLGWNTNNSATTAQYTGNDTFSISSNTTLYAIFTSDDNVIRKIGPGDGWVVYDKGYYSDGWRYIEAAPEDQHTGRIWSSMTTSKVLGTYSAEFSISDIGYGWGNTKNIIAQSGHTSSAALICEQHSKLYGGTTYADWFLPSMNELAAMHDNLHDEGVGSFSTAKQYWSSSEQDNNDIWIKNFNTGLNGSYYKAWDLRVRAVRSFISSNTYQLRDRGPANGWIFYIVDNGNGTKTYYEAEESDQSSSCVWSNIDSTLVPLGEHTVRGTGKFNSPFIVAQSSDSAAQICMNYNGGGYNDWVLPSKDELTEVRSALADTPEKRTLYGFSATNYWSSTEQDSDESWIHNFSTDTKASVFKNNSGRVRAIRSF